MKRLLTATGALTFAVGLSTAAAAAPGFATSSVNLRAGPSTSYPVVTTLRAGDGLTIHGCLQGYSWCDVTWRGSRGFVSSNYIQASYQGRRVRVVEAPPPVISFTFGSYWDNNYRGRSFYRDRSRFDRRDDRRDARIEQRDDRRDARIERNDDRRDARIERNNDRRDARAERRDDRRDRRADRRDDRQERNCPPGRDCS